MSPRAVLLIVALALLVTAGIVWGAREETEEPPSFELEGDSGPRGPSSPAATPGTEDERKGKETERGLPRILPPEAAVEDVRDALSLEDASARHEALAEAYAAIGRIIRNDRVLTALERVVADEEDARVRGVVLAALGARRDGVHLAWLAGKLSAGPAPEDHLGALLALAYDPQGVTLEAGALGGLSLRHGALPERGDVHKALVQLLTFFRQAGLDDMRPVLARAVKDGPYEDLASAVAALSK